MPTARITHALFDLDGVLLDTEPLYTQATHAVTSRFGKTYDWSIKRHLMGRDERVTSRIVVERLGLPLTPEQLLTERAPLLEALFAQCSPMPGAEAFVRGLVARGIPLAVATSSNSNLYTIKVQRHAWFELFSAVVCGDDPSVRAKKPAPDIFLAAARKLGAAPEACLVFEDSPAGVEAALAAGMRVIALPDPAMELEPYARAEQIARSFADVSLALLDCN